MNGLTDNHAFVITSQSVVEPEGVLLSAGRRVLLGLLLVGLGAVVLVDRAAGMDGGEAASTLPWRWWPLLIILAGALRVVWFGRRAWELIRPAVVVLVGMLCLGALELAEHASPLARERLAALSGPAAVIVAGVLITVAGHGAPAPSRPGELRESVWLRGDERRATAFSSAGRIRVVLGYLVLDLRGWEETSAPDLDVTVVLGHVRILVPYGVVVDRRPAFVIGTRGLQYRTVAAERDANANLTVHVIGMLGDAVVVSDAPKVDDGQRTS